MIPAERPQWGVHDISAADFVWRAFGERTVTPFVRERIDAMKLRYRQLDDAEHDAALRTIVETLLRDDLAVSGEQRRGDWERGWAEHLEKATAPGADWRALVPAYFGKSKIVRWQGQLVGAASPYFDYHSLAAIQWFLFDKWLRDFSIVYELGSGTGHNLLRLAEACPKATVVGLDWATASQRLVTESPLFDHSRIGAWKFDFFNPGFPAASAPHAMFSCAALEQVGERFMPMVDWMIAQRPAVVVHIEPLVEMLDPTNLLDWLSLRYCEKRGYLRGFLPHMMDLHRQGVIEIHEMRWSGVGSLMIDGYHILIWSPR